MSEVEQFWNAICAKIGNTRKWYELSQQEQQIFIQGINMMLAVAYNKG